MKGFYNKFLRVKDDEAVSDRTMLGRGIMTLVNVLVLLGALAVTAYAYFGVSATSPVIPVEAAHFAAELSVSETNSVGTTQLVSGEVAASHTVAMQAGNTYKITLKPAGNAQGGFCIINATQCDETYYTQQLGADASVSGGKTKKIEFTIVPTADTVMTIDTSWGTSIFYGKVGKNDDRYIFGGETVTMIVAGIQTPVAEEVPETTQPDDQTENQTTPTESQPATPEATQPEQPTDSSHSTEPGTNEA